MESNTSIYSEDLATGNLTDFNLTEIERCVKLGTCNTIDTSLSLGPLELVFPLLGVIMPILAVIALVSNTIIIIILSRPGMQSPTNIVLLSMAVCDLSTILTPTPWYVYLFSLGYHQD